MLNGTNKENCGNMGTQGNFGRKQNNKDPTDDPQLNSLRGKEYKSFQLFYVLQCLLDIMNVTSA